jgi:hypothetical protein
MIFGPLYQSYLKIYRLRDPSETPAFMTAADDVFQYLYTIEMVVKIVSLGFILN